MNPGKVAELCEMLAPSGIEVVGLDAFADITEVEETGSTLAENAELKARGYALQTGLVALADDSGLEVAAAWRASGRALGTIWRRRSAIRGQDSFAARRVGRERFFRPVGPLRLLDGIRLAGRRDHRQKRRRLRGSPHKKPAWKGWIWIRSHLRARRLLGYVWRAIKRHKGGN